MKIKQIVLASRPIGAPSTENFRFEEKAIESIKENEVLLNTLYISVDPYMRGRMNESKSYAKPYEVNQPIKGGIVAIVLESRSSLFSVGDINGFDKMPEAFLGLFSGNNTGKMLVRIE